MTAAFAAPLAIAGLSGIAGMFANKPKNVNTTQDSMNTSSTSGSASSTPNYDPESLEMRNRLMALYGGSLNDAADLSGYKAQGLSTITQAGNARTTMLKNALAARGLSHSPIAAIAPAMSEGQRIGDQSSFINSIPMLQRQLYDQRLNAAGSFFKGLPFGTTNNTSGSSTENSHMTGQNLQPGNPVGGGLSSLATTLAGLYGQGAFGNNKNNSWINPNTGRND